MSPHARADRACGFLIPSAVRVPLLPAVVALAVLALAASGAAAQNLAPVELSETDIYGMGARAMGMGMAYGAVSEDATAIFFNPAGLAQVRQPELTGGLGYDRFGHTTDHTQPTSWHDDLTRVDHVALAYPVPTYRGSLVLAVGFHRLADLNQEFRKSGYLIDPVPGTPGLYERETYSRDGMVDAWTGAVGYDLSPHISVGASLSYLRGKSNQSSLVGNYRATISGSNVFLDLGSPSSPDDRLFEQRTELSADLDGWTGSVAILGYLDSGFRLSGVVDLPVKLQYNGESRFRLEDWEKFDSTLEPGSTPDFFRDDISLPFNLRGGVSWGRNGLLLAGGVRWTDYTQVDFEGPINIPGTAESAYRSVVAVNLGVEYQLPEVPIRFRGGFFTEPIPYKLIAADTDFQFVPDDNNPNTTTDISKVYRDYPLADITSDQKFFTVGTGVLIEDQLSLDIAYLHGWWERRTPSDYQNGTTFYPTYPTVEKVTRDRIFLSTTLHFE